MCVVAVAYLSVDVQCALMLRETGVGGLLIVLVAKLRDLSQHMRQVRQH